MKLFNHVALFALVFASYAQADIVMLRHVFHRDVVIEGGAKVYVDTGLDLSPSTAEQIYVSATSGFEGYHDDGIEACPGGHPENSNGPGSGGGYGGRGGGPQGGGTCGQAQGLDFSEGSSGAWGAIFNSGCPYGGSCSTESSRGGDSVERMALKAKRMTLEGSIESNGGEGHIPLDPHCYCNYPIHGIVGYGGGGGSGGGILILAEELEIGQRAAIRANGGAGGWYSKTWYGDRPDSSYYGYPGGGGRIKIYYEHGSISPQAVIEAKKGPDLRPLGPDLDAQDGTVYMQQVSTLPALADASPVSATAADLNHDGKVDEQDMYVLTQHWGEAHPTATPTATPPTDSTSTPTATFSPTPLGAHRVTIFAHEPGTTTLPARGVAADLTNPAGSYFLADGDTSMLQIDGVLPGQYQAYLYVLAGQLQDPAPWAATQRVVDVTDEDLSLDITVPAGSAPASKEGIPR